MSVFAQVWLAGDEMNIPTLTIDLTFAASLSKNFFDSLSGLRRESD